MSFDLDEYYVRMMSLSPDGRIIVLGVMKYGNKWLFMEYNVHTGARLRRVPLQEDDQPNGMTMVNVAGNQCVAVSYRYLILDWGVLDLLKFCQFVDIQTFTGKFRQQEISSFDSQMLNFNIGLNRIFVIVLTKLPGTYFTVKVWTSVP